MNEKDKLERGYLRQLTNTLALQRILNAVVEYYNEKDKVKKQRIKDSVKMELRVYYKDKTQEIVDRLCR